MFVFDDLVEIDDRGMQEVLRAVPSDKLLLAMKGADDDAQGEDLQEHVAACGRDAEGRSRSAGPVRLSEVEAAQKEILAIVRKMAEAGTIQLGGKGEEFV